MAKQAPLQTVSLVVQESTRKKQRVSLPAGTHQTVIDPPSRPRSFSGSKVKIALPPAIPEVDTEEDSSDVRITVENGNGDRTSFTKKPPSRANSTSSTKGSRIKKSYDNGGFDDRTNRQFERGTNNSSRSSTHDSVISLQVQREQYCCCTRWTMFERRLALSVGILGGIIFCLAIAVGVLAGDDGADEKFLWKL